MNDGLVEIDHYDYNTKSHFRMAGSQLHVRSAGRKKSDIAAGRSRKILIMGKIFKSNITIWHEKLNETTTPGSS